MRKNCVPLILFTIGILLPAASWAAPGDSVPLKITGKSANVSAGKSAQLEPPGYTLSFRNESQQTITAWKLTCLYAEGDGNFATTSLERDAFFRYERGVASSTGEVGIVSPGATFDLIVPRDERMAHPYEAISCRVDAVLFAEGSYSGEPRAVADLFERRTRIAADALEAIDVLNRMIAAEPTPDSPAMNSIEELGAELIRDRNFYSDDLSQALKSAQIASPVAPLNELLARIGKEYSLVEKHLQALGGLESSLMESASLVESAAAPAPPNKLQGAEQGCEIDGASTPNTKAICSGSATRIKRLTFHVTAACRNPCTGATWQANSVSTTATGECPVCDTKFFFYNVIEETGAWTKRLFSDAKDKYDDNGVCENGAIHEASVDCYCPGCGDGSPVLISLSDRRYELTDVANGVRFDLDADGKAEQTAWTAPRSDEGFLALDRNLNGTIDDFMEIFGDHTPQLPSEEPNGWRALAVWDDSLNGGNEDGIIDVNDFIFTALQIWVDRNHNGFSEPSELSSLEEVGVEYLDLDYGSSDKTDNFGNRFKYWAEVGMSDGRVIIAWDVFFKHLL